MANPTLFQERDRGRSSKTKTIARIGHERKRYIKGKSIEKIDPADERIGLGPYLSIRKKKIMLVKGKEEDRRIR